MKTERRKFTQAEKVYLKVHFWWTMFYFVPLVFGIIEMSN